MEQETGLPDPEQLRTWAREMVPFSELDDLKIGHDFPDKDDSYLYGLSSVGDSVTVEYQYRPTYINVETAEDEWHRASDIEWVSIDHEAAWNLAMNVEHGEDYISATGMCSDPDQPAQYDAYWILETTRVTRHEA